MKIRIELLDKKHQKKYFDCGYPLLDNYIRQQAKQDVTRHLSACYVLANEDNIVLGYYTLSSSSINSSELPESLIKKYPSSYINLPVILLGRLAIDNNSKGNKYGVFLLIDALKRSFDNSIKVGAVAVMVDPIDDKAIAFYLKYGFILIPSTGKMFITMKTIEELF